MREENDFQNTRPVPRRRRVVYVLAQPTVSSSGHIPNIRALSDHGDVVFVITGDLNPLARPALTFEVALNRMKDFDPEHDYVTAVSSASLAALIMGYVLSALNIREFTWLSFQRGYDREGRRVNDNGWYRPVRMHVDQLDALPESYREDDAPEHSGAMPYVPPTTPVSTQGAAFYNADGSVSAAAEQEQEQEQEQEPPSTKRRIRRAK